MYAVIDVGSNTVRLNIYKMEYGRLSLVLNKKESVGLASYVKNGQMMPSGIMRVSGVLKEFRELLVDLGIQDVHVFATAALRNAKNSKAAVDEVEQRSGLKVKVRRRRSWTSSGHPMRRMSRTGSSWISVAAVRSSFPTRTGRYCMR